MGVHRQGRCTPRRSWVIANSYMHTRGARVLRGMVGGVVLAVGCLLLTLPQKPQQVDMTRWSGVNGSAVSGAFHIHTTRSDGGASVDEVAKAAQRAGLEFLIFTDHGDGTQGSDPPQYRSGVLTLDGVEVSTAGGHYIAVDLPPTPYPLGGEPDSVIEDVRRLGGFGIVAHPTSSNTDLRWNGSTQDFDGIEWLNGDSQWRDENAASLLVAAPRYLLRPSETLASLLDRPDDALTVWDESTRYRKVVGLAGSDAHALIATGTNNDKNRWTVAFPDYEQLFRTFSIRAQLFGPLLRDADHDANELMEALRAGRIYTVIDALATPVHFQFEATGSARTYSMGERVPVGDTVELYANVAAPVGSNLVLLADGTPVHTATDSELRYRFPSPASYRVEVYLDNSPGSPKIPWIVSNPIYIGEEPEMRVPSPRIPSVTVPLTAGGEGSSTSTWAIEHDANSTATVRIDAGRITFNYRLGDSIANDLSAAAVRLLDVGELVGFDGVGFDVVSDRPVRLSFQLRAGTFTGEGEPRWRQSFYADTTPRRVIINFDELDPVAASLQAQVDLSQTNALLVVVDQVNSLPGSEAEVVLSDVSLER